MDVWFLAAGLFLALVLEYELVVRWERWKHDHKGARRYPRPRRRPGRRY